MSNFKVLRFLFPKNRDIQYQALRALILNGVPINVSLLSQILKEQRQSVGRALIELSNGGLLKSYRSGREVYYFPKKWVLTAFGESDSKAKFSHRFVRELERIQGEEKQC